MDPFGLYLHIPFCLHKCGYCDFNSHPLGGQDTRPYVDALVRELEFRAAREGPDRSVGSLFFGGGTPTTLPAAELVRLLETCRQNFNLAPDCEITCEANPATLARLAPGPCCNWTRRSE